MRPTYARARCWTGFRTRSLWRDNFFSIPRTSRDRGAGVLRSRGRRSQNALCWSQLTSFSDILVEPRMPFWRLE